MWRNNYTEEYIYSFEEFLKKMQSGNFYYDSIVDFKTVSSNFLNNLNTDYWTTGNGYNLWSSVFGKHYHDAIIFTENELDTISDYKNAAKDFIVNFYSIWERTKGKYDKLLSLYQSEEDKLMNSLETKTIDSGFTNTSTSGEDTFTKSGSENTDSNIIKTGSQDNTRGIKVTTENITNDTPQNQGTGSSIFDDDHASMFTSSTVTPDNGTDKIIYNNISDKGNSSLSFTDRVDTTGYGKNDSQVMNISHTTTSDPMTVMARLEEVQSKYMNIIDSWVKYFDKLFVSTLNYEEA